MNIVSLYEYDVNYYNYIQLNENIKGNLIVSKLTLEIRIMTLFNTSGSVPDNNTGRGVYQGGGHALYRLVPPCKIAYYVISSGARNPSPDGGRDPVSVKARSLPSVEMTVLVVHKEHYREILVPT
jgi:hypothetical protein